MQPAAILIVKSSSWVTELAFPRMNLSLFLVKCLMINYCCSQQTALLFPPLEFFGLQCQKLEGNWRLQLCHYRTASLKRVITGLFFTSSLESQQTHTSSSLLFRTFFHTLRPCLCSRMPLAWLLYEGSGREVPLAKVAALAEAPEYVRFQQKNYTSDGVICLQLLKAHLCLL